MSHQYKSLGSLSTLFLILFLFQSSILYAQLFENTEISVDENLSITPLKIIAEDLDGDGDKDFVFLRPPALGNNLEIYTQESATSYTKETLNEFTGGALNSDIEDVETHDLSKDGFLDIILITGDALFQLINDQSGHFSNFSSNSTVAKEAFGVIAVDVTSETETGLILNYPASSELKWVDIGFGSGNTISASESLTTPFNLQGVDLDNDGLIDITSNSFSGIQFFYWSKNTGVPNLKSDIFYVSQVETELSYGDLDGDGDFDFFDTVANKWFLNDGNGAFDFQNISIDVPNSIGGVGKSTVADFDLDGDMDIIKGSTAQEQALSLLLNDGSGNFTEVILSDLEYLVEDLFAADIDNNGSQDLVIYANENGQRKLVWIPNTSRLQTLKGCAYFDENANGTKDSGERTIGNYNFDIESQNEVISISDAGCFNYLVSNGTYSITPNEDPNWTLSSTPSQYIVDVSDDSVTDLDFGFIPSNVFIGGRMNAVSGITRCNTDVRFDFTFQNQGTTIISEGIIFVFQDSLTELTSTEFPIDTMLNDRTFGFQFENLYPGETITRTVFLSVPGLGGDIEPGTLIEIFSATEAKNTQGFVNFFKHNYSEEIRCAYDPNDKLISPLRPENENYTLFGDTLVYTVRFQNTGNDTAFNVVIRDTLDQNLDVGTFNIIHSSHRSELSTDIQDGKNVTFNFENIMLPDSTIDFVGSQGYVTYSIQANDPVPEFTPVENTASIYFDFNPPIVTNTTINTMVSCYPIVEQTITATIGEGEVYELPDGSVVDEAGVYNVVIEDEEGCPIEIFFVTIDFVSSTSKLPLQNAIGIAPNPSTGAFTLDLDFADIINYRAVISDPLGKEIKAIEIHNQQTLVHTDSFANGVYFLRVLDEDGELLGVKKFVVGSGF